LANWENHMTTTTLSVPFPRNYSLDGPLNRRAVEIGLANAEWYKTAIPRARMKELMQRSDAAATRDTAIWIAALLATGGLGALFLGLLVVRAVLHCLRRAVRLRGRLTLA
jgi:fatty acid desaturase